MKTVRVTKPQIRAFTCAIVAYHITTGFARGQGAHILSILHNKHHPSLTVITASVFDPVITSGGGLVFTLVYAVVYSMYFQAKDHLTLFTIMMPQ